MGAGSAPHDARSCSVHLRQPGTASIVRPHVRPMRHIERILTRRRGMTPAVSGDCLSGRKTDTRGAIRRESWPIHDIPSIDVVSPPDVPCHVRPRERHSSLTPRSGPEALASSIPIGLRHRVLTR